LATEIGGEKGGGGIKFVKIIKGWKERRKKQEVALRLTSCGIQPKGERKEDHRTGLDKEGKHGAVHDDPSPTGHQPPMEKKKKKARSSSERKKKKVQTTKEGISVVYISEGKKEGGRGLVICREKGRENPLVISALPGISLLIAEGKKKGGAGVCRAGGKKANT